MAQILLSIYQRSDFKVLNSLCDGEIKLNESLCCETRNALVDFWECFRLPRRSNAERKKYLSHAQDLF